MQQGVDERACIVADGGVDGHVGGFVDGDEAIVFIDDIEGDIFGGEVEGLRFWDGEDVGLSSARFGVGFGGGGIIECECAFFDEGGEVGAGDGIFEESGEGGV